MNQIQPGLPSYVGIPSRDWGYIGIFGGVASRLAISAIQDGLASSGFNTISNRTAMYLSTTGALIAPIVLALPTFLKAIQFREYRSDSIKVAMGAVMTVPTLAFAGHILAPHTVAEQLLWLGGLASALLEADRANKLAGITKGALLSKVVARTAAVFLSIQAVQRVGGGDLDSLVAAMGLFTLFFLRSKITYLEKKKAASSEQVLTSNPIDYQRIVSRMEFRAGQIPMMIENLKREPGGFKTVKFMVDNQVKDWAELYKHDAVTSRSSLYLVSVVLSWNRHAQLSCPSISQKLVPEGIDLP